MLKLARLSDEDRAAVFTSTALKMSLSEAIVEKDFWVCWMLEILFHHTDYKKKFAFKGGTSLSKCYGIINRFSEDIDLILDWRVLGYDLKEPWEYRSNSAGVKFNTEINKKTGEFIKNTFMPHLTSIIDEQNITEYSLYIDEVDEQTLRFVYPQLFGDKALVQEIILEIGALAAWTPISDKSITPFVAEQFPEVFEILETVIKTVEAKRTFWEKATILHCEAFRTNSNVPARYSRHYYDLYLLYNSSIKEEAFADLELLKKVAAFKNKFYRSNRARYDLATKDELQLFPSDENLKILKNDYLSMQSMIFGDKIEFDEILKGLENMLTELKSI